ncbi:nitrite reductase small subunit NirD [Agarivorans sp. QJM3NY_33]|uniref:nitrite reductase small subunit NirD n=1 Tax=Agarivorans sp. QJM3NY_33 TaxID=3421432 RepID=UPI003D7C7E6C
MDNWLTICKSEDIAPNTGVCAKVGDNQVAIFLSSRTNSVHAITNFDPFGKANVLSRGIIGTINDRLCVASPLYKQHFDLHTGECLEQPEIQLHTYQVRINQGSIEIKQ